MEKKINNIVNHDIIQNIRDISSEEFIDVNKKSTKDFKKINLMQGEKSFYNPNVKSKSTNNVKIELQKKCENIKGIKNKNLKIKEKSFNEWFSEKTQISIHLDNKTFISERKSNNDNINCSYLNYSKENTEDVSILNKEILKERKKSYLSNNDCIYEDNKIEKLNNSKTINKQTRDLSRDNFIFYKENYNDLTNFSTKPSFLSNNIRSLTPKETNKKSSNEFQKIYSNKGSYRNNLIAESNNNNLKEIREINKSHKFLNELINVIKVRFYTENGFFSKFDKLSNNSDCNSRDESKYDEKELDKTIKFYLTYYNLDNSFVEESNKIIDEILINLNNHFSTNEIKNEFKKSSIDLRLENKLKKYTTKENFKKLPDNLRSFENSNLNKYQKNNKIIPKPAMKYNQYQKNEKLELKFYEEFDYKKNKLKLNNPVNNGNFLDAIKTKKSQIEKEIIKNIEKAPNLKPDKDNYLRDILNNITQNNKIG